MTDHTRPISRLTQYSAGGEHAASYSVSRPRIIAVSNRRSNFTDVVVKVTGGFPASRWDDLNSEELHSRSTFAKNGSHLQMLACNQPACSRPQIGHSTQTKPMSAAGKFEAEGFCNNAVGGSNPFKAKKTKMEFAPVERIFSHASI
ncbi:hypothetical protein ABID16_004499 [Rhizobium aquaticum]|uniref:Uncharacterized protein n=1 Tax=Rhizobium aquaticum TaxID=1549636 RepID=A0ABV2J5X3_9HYPH